jgi:hypothetical protein
MQLVELEKLIKFHNLLVLILSSLHPFEIHHEDFGEFTNKTVQAGFLPPFEAYTDKLESIRQFTNQPTSEGVCAVVKIQLTQRFVLTRNAFKATLEIDNGSGATLSKIKVTLFITNTTGSIRTSSFSILPPELENL